MQRVDYTRGVSTDTLLSARADVIRQTVAVPANATTTYAPNPALPTVLYYSNGSVTTIEPDGQVHLPDSRVWQGDHVGAEVGSVNMFFPATGFVPAIRALEPGLYPTISRRPLKPGNGQIPFPGLPGFTADIAGRRVIVKGPYTGRIRMPADPATGKRQAIKTVTIEPTPPAKPAGPGPGANGSVITTDGAGTFQQTYRDGTYTVWGNDGSVQTFYPNGDKKTWILIGRNPDVYDVTYVVNFPS